jgi:hypothetical protein
MNSYKPMIDPEKVRIFQWLMAAASVPLTDHQAQGLVEFFALIAADAVNKAHKDIMADMQRDLPKLFAETITELAKTGELQKIMAEP